MLNYFLGFYISSISYEFRSSSFDCFGNFIILNPAAFTHTSVALRDALIACELPAVEVHLSNIHAREEFRRRSLVADIVVGQVTGLGAIGYELALRALLDRLE